MAIIDASAVAATPDVASLTSPPDVTSVATDATNGHKFANDGSQRLRVKNASGSPVTVTVKARALVSGLAVADLVVSVAAGATKSFSPFPPSVFNHTDGKVYFGVSAASSVTYDLVSG